MPYISEYEKKKAEAFTDSLNSILELVETLSSVIGEGNYLTIANHLKILNDNKGVNEVIATIQQTITSQITQFRSNPIVFTQQRRTQMELMASKLQSDTDKTRVRCVRCDRRVTQEYLPFHQESQICQDVYRTKYLTCRVAKTEVFRYHDAISLIKLWCSKTGRYKKFVGKKPLE